MVRKAKTSDCQSISRLAHTAWWAHYPSIISHEQIAFMLEDMYAEEKLLIQMKELYHTFLMLEAHEGTLEGFASVARTGTEGEWKMHKLYLHPNSIGTGRGRLLLSEAEAFVCAQGGKYMKLNVNRANSAVSFYQSCGYSIDQVVDIPYHTFVLNDYIMGKSLLPA